MKKRSFYIFFCIFLLSGCGVEERLREDFGVRFVSAEPYAGKKTAAQRAEAIREGLSALEEVLCCTVVIEGRTAIVGLRCSCGQDTQERCLLLREAKQTILRADSETEYVSVTLNGRIVGLIGELEQKRAEQNMQNDRKNARKH